jgi:hypothetical protein
MSVLGGESVGTRTRPPRAERQHLEAVLDALPFLDGSDGISEWLIEDPEQALGAVETLPTLAAIAAVEWPKGKSVRVVSVDTRQLGVSVSRERDWFRLSGTGNARRGAGAAARNPAHGGTRQIPFRPRWATASTPR